MSPIRQEWRAESYRRHAPFVAELGAPLLALLDPRPGEMVLDLGCGDGVLTERLVAAGCQVVGLDLSPAMLRAARTRGLAVCLMDAQFMGFVDTFDAVFSNASLHWMPRVDALLKGVRRALRPGGRFVAECGGAGNVATVREALHQALAARGLAAAGRDPWVFPDPKAMAGRLAHHGFRVVVLALIPRPTILPTDLSGWLEVFAGSFVQGLEPEQRAVLLDDVVERVRPHLQRADGSWVVDYVRLRLAAVRV